MELLSVLGAMGMPLIDQSLEGLLQAMQTNPVSMGQLTAYAKTIGCCIALGVGANECYQMMLGRRGMDVMRLIHILIISLCISFSGSIVSMAQAPGLALEKFAKSQMTGKNDEVKALEAKVADKQSQYIAKINEIIAKAEIEKQNRPKPDGLKEIVKYELEDLVDSTKNGLMKMAMYTETKLCEWFSLVLRFLGELVFQMSYYGMLVAQRIFMAILAMFCPLMFAISLSPHFKSAWSQWLSKYISLSLWGFITYVCLYYVNFMICYNLSQDLAAYDGLITQASKANWESVGALGMQGLGSTCMYVMSLLVGAYIIRMVPEAASWCIPGGISSGAGEKSGSMGMAAVTGAVAGSMSVAPVVGKTTFNVGDKTLRVAENIVYGAGKLGVSAVRGATGSSRKATKSSSGSANP